MKIRRNPWLPTMVAAAVFVSPGAYAQNTTATADQPTSGSAKPAAASLKLEPGDQLLYSTKGEVSMSGMGKGQQQEEKMDLQTSLTVLQKQGDTYTMYAALTAAEETTAGKTQTPGPRFTFEMPVSGYNGEDEFEKAGIAGAAFPTFSVESLFASPAAEGSTTVTLPLPITNQPAKGEAVTTKDGANFKTVTSVEQDGATILKRTTVFNPEKNATQSIETSVTLSLNARNVPIKFAIQDKTELVSSTKLTAEQVETLKKDVEQGVKIATKLQALGGGAEGGPDDKAMKSLLEDTKAYLASTPKGEFSYLFSGITTQLESVVARTSNWEKIKVGEPVPDFTATTIDNKTVKLSDLKGKVVLLDFWATWCGPCIAELPNVKKVYEDNKDKGFQIIGISADENVADLQKLVESENLQWPQIFDGDKPSGSVQEQFGVMKYPTTILVDKEGKISAVDVRGEELGKAVEKLVGAK